MQRLIDAFSRWFSSSVSVWQTTAVVLLWVGVEVAQPQLDPHGFLVLYVLTVYSAVTQPALAYAANQSTAAAQTTMRAQEQLLRNSIDTMEAVLEVLRQLRASVDAIEDEVSRESPESPGNGPQSI